MNTLIRRDMERIRGLDTSTMNQIQSQLDIWRFEETERNITVRHITSIFV